MRKHFPKRPTPQFPGIAPDGFLAYGYLEGHIRFPIPYFDFTDPVRFVDSSGTTTPVHAFGLRRKDDGAFYELRRQARVLYEHGAFMGYERDSFAVDLCSNSQPLQIILAVTETSTTLGNTLADVEAERPFLVMWIDNAELLQRWQVQGMAV